MSKIIDWCNLNQGFLSAILSLFVAFFSIITSIILSNIPFKKKFSASVHCIDECLDNMIFVVSLYNIGKCEIHGSVVFISYKKRIIASALYERDMLFHMIPGCPLQDMFLYGDVDELSRIVGREASWRSFCNNLVVTIVEPFGAKCSCKPSVYM